MKKSTIRSGAIVFMLVMFGLTPMFAADAAAGKTVFDKHCKMCHGATGQGNPGMAKVLGTTIADLGSPEVQKMSDADIKKIITTGKGKMKPVAGLSDADMDNVIAHIRTLKK